MTSAAAIDIEHLRVQAAEDTGVMKEVLQLFLVHTEQVLAELETASEVNAWKQLTHTLKGSARGVGAFEVAEAAADAERAILDKSKLGRLHSAFAATRDWIRDNPV